MTIFKVGPDDTGLFNSERTTWEFDDALENANNGDEIEIQRDYNFPSEEKTYTIKKDLIIYSTSMLAQVNGSIFIKGGAHVKLENLSIVSAKCKSNCVQVREQSSLEAKNLSLTNLANSGENYPIIYIDDKSIAEFDSLKISENAIQDGNHKIYVENATIKISDGELNCKLQVLNSKVHLENSNICYYVSNTLTIQDNSTALITSVSITGGNTKKDYPCCFIQNSQLVFKNCQVNQPNYEAALYIENSNVNMMCSDIDSLNVREKSKVNLRNNCRIFESITVQAASCVDSDELLIDGRNNGKVNIFANGESSITARWIGFAFESSPNIKIEDNVSFNVTNLYILKYDSKRRTFITNSDNTFPVQKDITTEKISYFSNKKEKISASKDKKNNVSGMQQLDEMIGLGKVKNQVKEFIAVAVLNKKRAEKGLNTSTQTLHSLFLGNPGTGKTTVARIVGHLLYEKGVISEDKLVETSRADLVAGFIGQTAPKTRKVLNSALGGVLFIDEAYTLASGGQKDFGREAIDEILKFMEDNRSKIMIIFAGYTKNMEEFLETNPGLRSRIPNKFDFEDYSVDDLIQIGLLGLKKQQYNVDAVKYADLVKNNRTKDYDQSNGRWIRNLNDDLKKKQALRVAMSGNYTDEDLVNITDADLKAVRL